MTLESIERNRERIANLSTKYPWLADVEREIAELQRNHEFLQRIYDAAIADRNANWMKLPVDADGEPIHVGDELVSDGDVFVACAVTPGSVHRWKQGGGMAITDSYHPNRCRHHRKPTVEDVLREFTAELLREEELYGDKHREEVTVKYAGKLREAAMSE